VQLDPSGNIFLAGQFVNAVDIDPGPGTFNVNSGGPEAMFITEIDPSGNFICGGVIKGTGKVEGIMQLSGGDLVIAGGFENTADFNPGSGIDTIPSAGSQDIFLGKLVSCVSASVNEPLDVVASYVYPNPTTGKLKVSRAENSFTEIKVFNMLGDEILSKASKGMSDEIDLSDQPKGIYFVNITSGKEKVIKRVVVQ
jgi:hypothetical protein